MTRTGAESLVAALAGIVGANHVLSDPALKAGFETDWTRRFSGTAAAVVRPADVDEVAAVMRICQKAAVPVVPQGGNTGLVGGGVPRGSEVLLSLGRIDGLEPVDAVAAEVTVGAGVTLAKLQAHVRRLGFDFGVDLGARDAATVGGMIATNAGGTHVLRYGPMRTQLVGIEAVFADGRVLRRLPGAVKDNTGYHLPSLLAGSEGTLAVITRARVRLVPEAPKRATALLGLTDVDAALRVMAHVRNRLPTLHAAEFFGADGLEIVRQHTGAAPPFAAERQTYLLLESAGRVDPADDLVGVLTEVIDLDDVIVAGDQPTRARLWSLRERHSEAINAAGVPHKFDVTLPLSRLAEFDRRVRRDVSAIVASARTVLWGHLGDGNLHVNVLGLPPEDYAVDDAVLRLVVELGGSISAEHGIGVAKTRWMPLDRHHTDLQAMYSIKRALDPHGILNPGVLLPRALVEKTPLIGPATAGPTARWPT